MASVTRDDIAAALSAIMDEDSGKDVVSAGLIQGLVVREGHVGFSVEVDPKKGAEKEPLRKACEEAVKRLPGVLSVTAVLTAHRDSASPSAGKGHSHSRAHDHSHGGEQQRTSQGAMQIPGVKAIIAVASGKGGVGKSTVAVNLALALSKLGRRVGLLDADIYGPSLPQLFNVTGRPATTAEKKLIPVECHGLHTMSIGYMVPPDQAMIWRGPMVQSALIQMLDDVAWPELDVLVLDMPPGTGDIQLTTAQRIPVSGAVVVSTPSALAQADVRRARAMFEKTNVPVLGLVENMAFMTAPDGTRMHPFGNPGNDALMSLPLDAEIHAAAETGVPVVIDAPQSAAARAFGELAQKLIELLEGAKT